MKNSINILSDIAYTMYRYYAKEVIYHRALPELVDGLKPVARRVLYTMYLIGLMPDKPTVKSTRVVGDCLGKFHSHGDLSVYGSMQTLVKAVCNPIYGQGSWGSIQDPNPAAHRYTECKLSKYGMTFLDKDYLAVTPMQPNYDGKDLEPIVLPALLPNLFLNATDGIAVGFTTEIPPLDPIPLLNLTQKILKKENISIVDTAKRIKAKYSYGGATCLDTSTDIDNWQKWWNTGEASCRIKPSYTLDEKTGVILINGFAPNILNTKTITTKQGKKKIGYREWLIETIEQDSRVQSILDITSKKSGRECIIEVIIKKQHRNSKVFQEILKYFYSLQHYKTSVIQQNLKSVDKVEDVQIDFLTNISPIELLKRWCIYRIELEIKCLNYKIDKQNSAIKNTELLIFACINRETILNALKNKEPDAYLIKFLKLTVDEVKRILDLPIRRLSLMDQALLKNKLKEQKEELKVLQLYLKDPTSKVINDIEEAKKLFKHS